MEACLSKISITAVSDLHGHYPDLEGGDLLIVAGDVARSGGIVDNTDTLKWLHKQKYQKKILIAGNHDTFLEWNPNFYSETNVTYLCDSGTEFSGLKIWGSPWTKRFPRMNPHCMAFTVDTEKELSEKWELIPADVDILVTHGPCRGNGDKVGRKNVGSLSLSNRMAELLSLKLHVCGHIHEGHGMSYEGVIDGDPVGYLSVNASLVNEHYESVNKPIRIEL